MWTLSVSCLFRASPPKVPVTFILKGMFLLSWSSLQCKYKGLVRSFLLRAALCSNPLVYAFRDVSPIYLHSQAVHCIS